MRARACGWVGSVGGVRWCAVVCGGVRWCAVGGWRWLGGGGCGWGGSGLVGGGGAPRELRAAEGYVRAPPGRRRADASFGHRGSRVRFGVRARVTARDGDRLRVRVRERVGERARVRVRVSPSQRSLRQSRLLLMPAPSLRACGSACCVSAGRSEPARSTRASLLKSTPPPPPPPPPPSAVRKQSCGTAWGGRSARSPRCCPSCAAAAHGPSPRHVCRPGGARLVRVRVRVRVGVEG